MKTFSAKLYWSFLFTYLYVSFGFAAYEDTRVQRKNDWSYRQNWRNDKEAYFRGENQLQAYRNKNGNGKYGRNGFSNDKKYSQQPKYENNGRSQNFRYENYEHPSQSQHPFSSHKQSVK